MGRYSLVFSHLFACLRLTTPCNMSLRYETNKSHTVVLEAILLLLNWIVMIFTTTPMWSHHPHAYQRLQNLFLKMPCVWSRQYYDSSHKKNTHYQINRKSYGKRYDSLSSSCLDTSVINACFGVKFIFEYCCFRTWEHTVYAQHSIWVCKTGEKNNSHPFAVVVWIYGK